MKKEEMGKAEKLEQLAKGLNQVHNMLGQLSIQGAQAEAYVTAKQNIIAIAKELVTISQEVKACAQKSCTKGDMLPQVNGKAEEGNQAVI